LGQPCRIASRHQHLAPHVRYLGGRFIHSGTGSVFWHRIAGTNSWISASQPSPASSFSTRGIAKDTSTLVISGINNTIYSTTAGSRTATLTIASNNPDGDGVNNLLEFALGLPPMGNSVLPAATIPIDNTPRYFHLGATMVP
jgi:hypothetical protein